MGVKSSIGLKKISVFRDFGRNIDICRDGGYKCMFNGWSSNTGA